MSTTTDPNDERLTRGGDEGKEMPQADTYLVLSDEEKAKGFVRPVRKTYVHVGPQPKYPLRDVTDDEQDRYGGERYVKFEEYPESESPATGRFWTQEELDNNGCGTATTMNPLIAETYAREPRFYGFTYCCRCGSHIAVKEFQWDDGSTVGS